MIDWLRKLRQYLLTGVSYVIPCIACGGILIAASLALAPRGANNAPDPSKVPALALMLQIGVTAFKLALPILAGFIAHAMAGKPGLVPGLIGGFLASGFPASLLFDARGLAQRGLQPDSQIVAGFLGAIIIGLIAGGIVNLIKKLPVPKYIKPIMPILIIPIVSSAIVAALMFEVLGVPIANLMSALSAGLNSLGKGNAVVLAMVLGAMIAFDMGGPVNKAAFFFGSALITAPVPNYAVMGACAAAICTPPLGMGLATLIRRKLWSDEEKEAGIAALAMGMIGITEGAIPFAASDPLRVIPTIMFGSMVAAVVAMLGGVGDHAPHGGPIVLPVVDNRIMYVIAIIIGTVVTALMINILKSLTRKRTEELAEVAA